MRKGGGWVHNEPTPLASVRGVASPVCVVTIEVSVSYLFISCLASIVMYFLLCSSGTPAPGLRDFALLACLTCSLEECFIRDVVMGLVRTAAGLGVATAVKAAVGRVTMTKRKKEKKAQKVNFRYQRVASSLPTVDPGLGDHPWKRMNRPIMEGHRKQG